jgi:hypothetical protein
MQQMPARAARIASSLPPHHIVVMANDRYPDRGPERPRQEPEIIPPGQEERARLSSIFMRFDERDGVHRIYIGRPGLGSIILGLLLIGLVAGVAFLVVAGLIILWVPILIGGILLALLSGLFRRRS